MLLASEKDRRHRQAVDTMSEAAVVVDPPDFVSFRRRDFFVFSMFLFYEIIPTGLQLGLMLQYLLLGAIEPPAMKK